LANIWKLSVLIDGHRDGDLDLGEEILSDGIVFKDKKGSKELEVAIGDGMEFTIHGEYSGHGFVYLSIIICGRLHSYGRK